MSTNLNIPSPPPPPIFTLRGHDNGVTALASFKSDNTHYLISGDDSGNIIGWDLSIFRTAFKLIDFCNSRIQSLRVINLVVNGINSNILVVQTRDHDTHLLNINKCITQDGQASKSIETFASYPSIFSRGDAINIQDQRAILAYPSCLENYLVTIRLLSTDAKTIHSGTAQRNSDKEKGRTVFDIQIKALSIQDYILVVAYEDGHLCVFKFALDSFKRVPHLQSTGFKVNLVKDYDLKISDFISAFDCYIDKESRKFHAFCGSPTDSLICIDGHDIQDDITSLDIELSKLKLKSAGVSVVKIRQDKKLFAIGGWDNTLKLYSNISRKVLASLKYHTKQVADILHIEKDDVHTGTGRYLMCCGSAEGTISISCLY